jgi:hypothetical protein
MSWGDLTHAVLPSAVLLPYWVKLSWALVMSAVVLRAPLGQTLRVVVAVGVALLGGALSGYLALAFQTPSLVLVAWAVWCWVDALQEQTPRCMTPTPMAVAGVALGWMLVVDTLNGWPAVFNVQLYALGFESVGLWAVLILLAAALWRSQVSARWLFTRVSVLALYVVLRLPTGNVWDAVLDPFVWLALHVQLWRTWRARASGELD